jgi:hypothetical protein
METRRRRVSRDTRLLFFIVLISVGTLWVLARIRFPDRVPTPNPVAPVLAQLSPPSAFDDIASTVAQLEPALQGSLLAIDVRRRVGATTRAGIVPALRFRDGAAAALLDGQTEAMDGGVESPVEAGRDPATQLTVVRTATGPVPALTTWTPRQPESPRFLLAADVRPQGTSLRPVFVGSLYAIESPLWGGRVWALPGSSELAPGTLVFNLDGAFAGVAIARSDGVALVPGDLMIARAEQLLRDGGEAPGQLGVRVQALTPDVAAAVGAVTGVVVTWVDPQGPAANALRVTDIIEAVAGQPSPTLEYWQARAAAVRAGEAIAVTVRRRDGVRDVTVTAAPIAQAPVPRLLGLTLRTVRRVGAEVVQVDPGSVAFRAGIERGDVITVFGDVEAPTAAQVARAFAAAAEGTPLLVALTRDDTHRVLALERPR